MIEGEDQSVTELMMQRRRAVGGNVECERVEHELSTCQ